MHLYFAFQIENATAEINRLNEDRMKEVDDDEDNSDSKVSCGTNMGNHTGLH